MALFEGYNQSMTSPRHSLNKIRITVLIALLVLVAITVLRIYSVNQLPDQGFFAKYTEIAQEILSGHTPHDRLADLSAGYLWFVVLCFGPMGMDAVALRTTQIIGVSLAAGICGAAAWRRWGFPAAIGTTAVLLASKAVLVNATEIEPETLILVLTSIGLSLIVAFDQPGSRTVAGLALGLAVVTRPSVLLPVVLTIVGVGWKGHPRGRFLAILPLVLGVVLPILAMRLAFVWTTGAPPTPMNPGTVLSEGWNPQATGYLGEAPVVVKDVEHTLGLPDGLHVAYRLVAARATDQPMSPENANGYWAERALAFVRHEPGAALTIALRKAVLGVHSYDAWDLKTLQRKSEQLRRGLFIPFAFLAALAAIGVILGRRQPWTPALGLWVVGGWLVMVLFYVTARQRNVLLPAVAILVGVAINGLSVAWRSGRRKEVAVALAIAILPGVLLSLEGAPQREDRHGWRLLGAQEVAAQETTRATREDDKIAWLARGATFLDPMALQTASPGAVEREVRAQLATEQPAQRYFDLALVMIEIGQFQDAERLLQSLDAQGYHPRRGARWCSSTAYHLARCRSKASDLAGAQSLMPRALEQAPGDPRVLALRAVLSEFGGASTDSDRARRALTAMFDPFTGNRALALAYSDIARPSEEALLLAEIQDTLPEWNLFSRP